MPTVAQQFFLGTVDDDQDYPGVTENVKKLQETAPATNTTTTVTWTTTTITEKTVIPLTANQANGDTTTTNGWAFNDGGADGLGSVAGALRRIPAGVWNFSVQMTLNTPAVLDTHALTLTAKVYRVADINAGAGGARTLLFTATSANQTGSATVTWSSVSQPEVLLQPGQVVMIGITATSASTTALVLGANTNTVMTVSLGANTHATVPAPGVETIANTNGSSSGTATSDGALAGVGSVVGTSDGLATVSGALAATGATAGTANGLATANGALSAVAPTEGASSGLAAATGALAATGATVGTSDGLATVTGLGATVIPTAGSSVGFANVAGLLAAIGAMSGSAVGVATAQGSMGAVAETAGASAGMAIASGAMAAVAPTVGTVQVGQGGETINVIRPLILLEG